MGSLFCVPFPLRMLTWLLLVTAKKEYNKQNQGKGRGRQFSPGDRRNPPGIFDAVILDLRGHFSRQ